MTLFTQRGNAIDGEAAGDRRASVSLSSDGAIVPIGARKIRRGVTGRTSIYAWNGITRVQRGSNINQKSQVANPKRLRSFNSEITKKTKSSSKKHIPLKNLLNKSNHPPNRNLIIKKLSEKVLQGETIWASRI